MLAVPSNNAIHTFPRTPYVRKETSLRKKIAKVNRTNLLCRFNFLFTEHLGWKSKCYTTRHWPLELKRVLLQWTLVKYSYSCPFALMKHHLMKNYWTHS